MINIDYAAIRGVKFMAALMAKIVWRIISVFIGNNL